jgi:hypothetical protein
MVMGLSWGDIGAFGLPGGPEYNIYKQFKRGNGYTPPGASTIPPLQAGDVKLLPELQAPLEGINTKRQTSLADSLGTLGTREATSARASGRTPGVYAPAQITAAGGRASRSIEDALRGDSGVASLQDIKNQRAYDANVKLASEIGAINAPSLFQQLVQGATLSGQSASDFKGLYDALGRNDRNKNKYQDPSYNDPYSFGGGNEDYAYS